MIYLPGSGIMAAYTDSSTGALVPEFYQAVAIYLWAWFIVTVLYTIGAMRSSWVLFLDLAFLDVSLLLLACGFMAQNESVLNAGYAVGYIVSFLSCKLCINVETTSNDANIC
jgi:hypothetical protein